MKPRLLLLLGVSLFVSGCDYINHEHYRIMGVTRGAPDAAKVKSILHTTARKTHLTDRTADSDVPDTLAYYETAHPTQFNPAFVLGARFYQGDILIEIDGPFGPKIPRLNRAQRLLVRDLSKEFGPRFLILGSYVENNCHYVSPLSVRGGNSPCAKSKAKPDRQNQGSTRD